MLVVPVGALVTCDKQQTHDHDGLNITTRTWGVRHEAWQCGASCLSHNSRTCNVSLFMMEYARHVVSTIQSITLLLPDLIRAVNIQQLGNLHTLRVH